MSHTYLISGGGTGGHVYPAIAIADALRQQEPDCKIVFAGTRDRMEWIAVPKAGYEIRGIWVSGIQRKISLKNLMVPIRLMVSIVQSIFIIRDVKPDAVICTGGYVCGPVGWAAARMGKPLFLQEQNSYPGLTIRKLAKDASLIFTAFDSARKYLPASKVILCGNPTRKELIRNSGSEAHRHFGFDPKRKTLLILGGSGGAKAINDAVLDNFNQLHDGLALQIIWQCGERYLDMIREVIAPSKYQRLRLYSFVDYMQYAYSAADLVVTRAGASVCAELMVSGKPGVLVPSPNVTGDHQTKNAKAMEEGGAAIVVRDADVGRDLVGVISKLFARPDTLYEMSKAAKRMASPEAAGRIAFEINKALVQIGGKA